MLPPHAVPTKFLDTIGGIPLHPLIVHAAVVILPLGAVGLVAIILVPRWRAAFGWLVMGALAAGTVSVFAAVNSGEALAERVGEPERHADLGETLQIVAAILFVVAAAWFWLQRGQSERTVLGSAPQAVAAIAALALAAGTLVLTVLVGHSGAESVWGGTVAAGSADSGDAAEDEAEDDEADDDTSEAGDDSAAAITSAPPATSPDAGTAMTMADVAASATASSCWAAVDGTVYDLTSWIGQHPGGSARILALCGTDASAAFSAQHSGDTRPAEELAAFELGPLG